MIDADPTLPRTTRIDALLLAGDDPSAAERWLRALAPISAEWPLTSLVIEGRSDPESAGSLRYRGASPASSANEGSITARVNRALALGDGPLVLLADAAQEVATEAIRRLVLYLEQHAEVDAAGLGVLGERALKIRSGAVGPVLLVRRAALAAVGALDELGYSGLQAEAEAWCRRAQRAGCRVELSAGAGAVGAAPSAAPIRRTNLLRLVMERPRYPLKPHPGTRR